VPTCLLSNSEPEAYRSIQKYMQTRSEKKVVFCAMTDGRGHHVPANKTPTCKLDVIRQHIDSFEKIVSHYCRSSSNREYLDPCLSCGKDDDAFKNVCELKYGTNINYSFENNDNDVLATTSVSVDVTSSSVTVSSEARGSSTVTNRSLTIPSKGI